MFFAPFFFFFLKQLDVGRLSKSRHDVFYSRFSYLLLFFQIDECGPCLFPWFIEMTISFLLFFFSVLHF